MTTTIRSLLGVLAVLIAAPFLSAASPIEGELTVPYTNVYAFRGQRLAGESIQPSVSLSLGNLTATVWANQPIAREVDPEIDFTLSLDSDISIATAQVGLTAYRYPGGTSTTWEPYLSLSKDVRGFKGAITAFYDWKLGTHTYQAALSRDITLTKRLTLTPKVMAGVVGSYSYWEGGGETVFAVNKGAAVFGAASYTSSNDRAAERDIISYTAGLRVSF